MIQREAMRPAPEHGSLHELQEELLEKVSSLACKAWKMLRELTL